MNTEYYKRYKVIIEIRIGIEEFDMTLLTAISLAQEAALGLYLVADLERYEIHSAYPDKLLSGFYSKHP